MTKSRGESVCVFVFLFFFGGGGLRCKFSFVNLFRIFVLRLQDRNINRSTLNDGFYLLTSCQDRQEMSVDREGGGGGGGGG